MAEAYCVKDKQKVEVQNAQQITMKNGKPALQGTCPICGGKVFRIGAADPEGSPLTNGPSPTAGALPCPALSSDLLTALGAAGWPFARMATQSGSATRGCASHGDWFSRALRCRVPAAASRDGVRVPNRHSVPSCARPVGPGAQPAPGGPEP